MALIASKYDLADEHHHVKVTYTTTHRTSAPPGTVQPLFIIAPMLEVDLGVGPVQYGPSEYSTSQIGNPALTAITVSIEKTVDAGGVVFTVLLPAPSLPQGMTEGKVEAVAFETRIRTFLVNVGHHFAPEEFRSWVLRGTYSESEVPPGAG